MHPLISIRTWPSSRPSAAKQKAALSTITLQVSTRACPLLATCSGWVGGWMGGWVGAAAGSQPGVGLQQGAASRWRRPAMCKHPLQALFRQGSSRWGRAALACPGHAGVLSASSRKVSTHAPRRPPHLHTQHNSLRLALHLFLDLRFLCAGELSLRVATTCRQRGGAAAARGRRRHRSLLIRGADTLYHGASSGERRQNATQRRAWARRDCETGSLSGARLYAARRSGTT